MANNFGKGIKVTSGFDLSAKGPLDNRTVVDTISQRDAHVSAGRAYEGLKVFVTATQKEYVYTNTGWVESGGITDDQLAQLTIAYTHSTTEHVSKEMVDNLNEQIQSLPSLSEINEMVKAKADVEHNHNDIYYTQTEVDEKIVDAVTNGQVDLSNYATINDLARKSDLGHSHTITDITELSSLLDNKANKDEVATLDAIAGKADISHSHDVSSIGNLQSILDSKANMTSVYNRTELNIKFSEINESLSSKADTGHNHDDVYYTQKEVDSAIAKAMTDGKVDLSNYATIADLNTKANIGHNHNDVYATIEHQHNEFYSKSDIDSFLANKADGGHNHNDVYYTQEEIDQKLADVVTNGQLNLEGYATKNDLTNGLATKANISHVHTPSEIEGIEDILPDTYDKQEIDAAITTAKTEAMSHSTNLVNGLLDGVSDEFNTLNKIEDKFLENKTNIEESINDIEKSLSGKSDAGHNHNDDYYDKATVENMIETGISGANLEQYATKTFVSEELTKKANLAHQHTFGDIENLNDTLDSKMNVSEGATKTELQEGLATKAAVGHKHDDLATSEHSHSIEDLTDLFDNVYTEKEVDDFLATKADGGHNHNDIYYTQEQVDNRIQSGIDGVDLSNLATKSELSQGLAAKANAVHDHDISEIKELQAALDAKADLNDFNTSNTQMKDYVDRQIIQAKTEAGVYTDNAITALVDSAPEAMNTLNELASAITENKGIYDAYVETIAQQLDSKADIKHNHDGVYANADHTHELDELTGLFDNVYNKKEVDNFLAGKSNAGHVHNDIYYTQEEVDERIQSGVDSVDLSGLATKTELSQGLATKAELSHSHEISNINGLQDELNSKINANIAATKEELTQGLNNKSDMNHRHDDDYAAKVHNHNDLYYTKQEVDTNLGTSEEETILKAVTQANAYTDVEILKVIGGENEKEITTITGTVNALLEHEQNFNKYKEEVNTSLAGKAPAVHGHDISQVTGLQDTIDSINTEINKKANADNVYTKTEIDTALQGKAEAGHNHDDKYSELEHTHIANEITDLYNDIYKKTEVDAALNGKSDAGHTHDDKYPAIEHNHTTENITDLFNKVYDKKEIDTALQSKAEAGHHHDDKYSALQHKHVASEITDLYDNIYNKSEINSALQEKAEANHGHDISEITDLQNTLNAKADKIEVGTQMNNLKLYLDNELITAKAESNRYTDSEILKLIDTAPDNANTLNKLLGIINYNKNACDAHINAAEQELETKADINHVHDGIYAYFSHTHELTDLNGLEAKLEKVQSDAITQAVTDANKNTENKIKEILGGDNAGANTVTGLAFSLSEHIAEFNGYKTEVEAALGQKSNVGHGHDISNVSGLQEALDSKANVSDVNNINTNLSKAIDDSRILAETNAQNYTNTEIAKLVDSAPDAMNTLNELATAIKNNKDIYDAYVETVNTALGGKSDVGHKHDEYITKEELEEEIGDIDFSDYALKTDLDRYAPVEHNHDDNYSKLNHNHNASEITDLNKNYYNKSEMETLLSNKSDSNHGHDETYSKLEHDHVYSDITDLTDNFYTETEMDGLLSGKADISHNHDTIYYRKYLVDAKINALSIDSYAKLEDLTTWANQFALKNHTHDDMSNVTLISEPVLDEILLSIFGTVSET